MARITSGCVSFPVPPDVEAVFAVSSAYPAVVAAQVSVKMWVSDDENQRLRACGWRWGRILCLVPLSDSATTEMVCM